MYLIFVIQHAVRTRSIVPSFVASLAQPHFFPHHKRHDFQKEFIEHNIFRFDSPHTFSYFTFLIVRRIERDIIYVHKLSWEVPVILVGF